MQIQRKIIDLTKPDTEEEFHKEREYLAGLEDDKKKSVTSAGKVILMLFALVGTGLLLSALPGIPLSATSAFAAGPVLVGAKKGIVAA